MINVEERALRALEQNALALAPLALKQGPDSVHERQDLRRNRRQVFVHGQILNLGQTMTAPQRIVVRKQPVDLSAQRRQVLKIHESDGAAADLVLISRADAALGRADTRRRIVRLA